jgi:hypothetical protein
MTLPAVERAAALLPRHGAAKAAVSLLVAAVESLSEVDPAWTTFCLYRLGIVRAAWGKSADWRRQELMTLLARSDHPLRQLERDAYAELADRLLLAQSVHNTSGRLNTLDRKLKPVHDAVAMQLRSAFTIRFASVDMADSICRKGFAAVGRTNHVSAHVLQLRIARCPTAVEVILKGHAGASKVAGYSILYPLTTVGLDRVVTGLAARGMQLELADISADFSDAAALYIGMIYGTDALSRAYALLRVKERVDMALQHSSLRMIFAYPATPEGLRIMQSLSFDPSEPGRAWVLRI